MSLIFQRSLPTPLSSQKCPPASQITTQFGFFHSAPHLNKNPNHSTTAGATSSSIPLLMDSCLHHLNWLHKLDARMKEFIGRISLDKRIQQMQYGCRMNLNHGHHRCQENKQENTQRITQIIMKLLLSITPRTLALLGTTRILPPIPPRLPPLVFPSSPWSLR